MKKILFIIALLPFIASGQANDTSRVLQPISGDGYQWKRTKADSAAYFPVDTFLTKKNWAAISFGRNGLPYYKSPGTLQWTLFGSGGGTGTVTGVSTSGGSPLFTTTITPGAVPNIGFTLSPSVAYTIYGNNAGSPAAPSFFTPTLASAMFQNQGSATTFLRGNGAGNPSWSAINLATDVTGVLPPANGGNALTTLGDMLSFSTVPVRVPGNVTAIKQVLNQTGTGSISALPVWTDASSYIPNGELPGDTWVSVGNGRDATNQHTAFTYTDGLASAGMCPVTLVADSTYHVGTPCSYYIGGVPYTSAGGNVKVKSDPTFDKQYAIVVNTSSLPDTVGGTAQVDPEVPTVGSTELFLTSVYVHAGDATPTSVGQTVVRDETFGTGEYYYSRTATIDSLYTGITARHLTYSTRLTAATNNQYFQLNAPNLAVQSKSTYSNLILYIYNVSALANLRNFSITLRLNGAQVAGSNAVNPTAWGYVKSSLSNWQLINIPIAAFGGGDAFNQIRITNLGSGGTLNVLFDWIQFQSGIIVPAPGNSNLFARTDIANTTGAAAAYNQSGQDFKMFNGRFYIGSPDAAKKVEIYSNNGEAGVIKGIPSLFLFGGGSTGALRLGSDSTNGFIQLSRRVGEFTADFYSSGNTSFGSIIIQNTGPDVAFDFGPENGAFLRLRNIPNGVIDSLIGIDASGHIVRQDTAGFGGGGGGSGLFPLMGTGTATGAVIGALGGETFRITASFYPNSMLQIIGNGSIKIGDVDGDQNGNRFMIDDPNNLIQVKLGATGTFVTNSLADTANYVNESYVTKAWVDDHIANANPSITIGTTGLISGGSNRLLYQNGSAKVSESSSLTFDGSDLTVSTVVMGNSLGIPYIQLPNSTTSRFLIGSEVVVANVTGNDQWMIGSAAGDIAYRNTSGKLLFGNSSGSAPGITISSNKIGLSTVTPNSTLQNMGSTSLAYVAKTANYTATDADYTIDCTANSFTITLPTAVGIQGRIYIIKNTGAGTITLATTSSQTIDGASPGTVAAGTVIVLQSTNANWIKVN